MNGLNGESPKKPGAFSFAGKLKKRKKKRDRIFSQDNVSRRVTTFTQSRASTAPPFGQGLSITSEEGPYAAQ